MAPQLVLVAALLVLGAVHETFAQGPEVVIVGGRPASPGEFPHQVSLRTNNNHFCGGSLISNKHVLTAAHCIVGNVAYPFTGTTVVTGSLSVTGGEHHRIKDVAVHPYYVAATHQNDIAIITLDDPVKPSQYQRPIRLAYHEVPEGARLTTSGWGYLTANGPSPRMLQAATVTALSTEKCQFYHGQPIINSQLCTAAPAGKGTCMGDSGGPLIYNGELVGITSFGIPCANGIPDVFTKVSSYLDFINSIVQK